MRITLKTIMPGSNMRKNAFSFFICIFATNIQAKTTYIPTYDNRLLLIENGEVDSLTNKSHSLVMSSKDGLITCTLAQQVVSQELVGCRLLVGNRYMHIQATKEWKGQLPIRCH